MTIKVVSKLMYITTIYTSERFPSGRSPVTIKDDGLFGDIRSMLAERTRHAVNTTAVHPIPKLSDAEVRQYTTLPICWRRNRSAAAALLFSWRQRRLRP